MHKLNPPEATRALPGCLPHQTAKRQFKPCRRQSSKNRSLPSKFRCPRSTDGAPTSTKAAVQQQPLERLIERAEGGSDGVKAVLFDMDGVLCNSEELSQRTGVQVLEEIYGIKAQATDFVPFAGTGEANFLGGVARKYGASIDIAATKERYFELYLRTASSPDYKIGYPGAVDLVRACRSAGLKTAVASSADRVKVDANLKAAGFDAPRDFDAIISADKFELLKPAPDIFLAAAQALGVHPDSCVVMEDAPAGVQAARAAGMLCIGVTTSLSEADMKAQLPDAVYPQIGQVSLEQILTLQQQQSRLTHGAASDNVHSTPANVNSEAF